MTDNSTSASGWYSYCDVAVDAAETTTSLCHHASLDVVVATTDENQLIIYDANSGKLLQSYEHNKKIGGALQCVYHEAGGGLAISDGINFGYRRQSNGLVLLNEALQTQIKSSKENVCIELQHSEATLLMSFISESTSESSHDVKVDEISNGDVKELYKTLLKQVKTESGHSQTSVGASSKWNTVIVELPYETVKNACLNLLEPYHKYLTDMAKADGVYRNTVASINASYGLPIVSSILHRLVLLYPCDHPGCVGKVIESPNRSLMYSELARGATFTRWPHRRYRWASPKAMAQAGFYHQPSAMGDDRALCFACNVCLVCWEPSDEPWSEHERHSPGCPFVCGEPTVNIPLSLTYALQPAHRMPFSDADAQSYFMAIAQNSGYLMTATTEGHLAMWNINKVSKLVARLRLSTETFTEALKDRITTSRKYATCTSFEITSLCALENTSSETNDNGGQEDEKTDRQSTCMALGAVVCVEEANSDDATEVEDNSSSVDGSAKKKMSSCLYSIVVIIKPILKRSHTRKPTSSTLKLSEAAFYHEAIPTDAYPGDMYPEPDEPLPNGAMTPIPINIQSFTPPPDATLIVMSDEDTDVQEEDKSNKEEEPLLKASNEEIKKKDGDHSKLEVISCCVIDKIDDISSFGVDDEAIKRVTRMVCDKAENVAVLSVKSSIDGNNGICKLDLVTNTTQFALNNLSISKISYVPHDFTEPLSDCDTYNSDNEDLNLSGYESSSTNTQEFIMCLSECGKILLLEINTLEIVHEFMLNDVWNDTPNNNTATGGRITSFVYCPSNKICISTNISKMMFVKILQKTVTPALSASKKRKQKSWCEASELSPETETKIECLKCIARWVQGAPGNYSISTLRLLQHVLANNGDLMKSNKIPVAEMAHLRLSAAMCVMKIARVRKNIEHILPELYEELALLVNDEVPDVRQSFITKLFQLLYSFTLPPLFLSLFAMVAQEKNKDNRLRWTHYYCQLIKRYRDSNAVSASPSRIPEASIPYLIHILSSDPDLRLHGINKDGLARARGSLQFMMEPILEKSYPESFGFVKRMTELLKRTKMVENIADDKKNEVMYAVCDLTMQLVLQRSAQHAVAVIEPADKTLLRLIPQTHYTKLSAEENNTNYLPEEFRVISRHIPTPANANADSGKIRVKETTANQRRHTEKKNIGGVYVTGGQVRDKKVGRKLVVAVSKVAVATPPTANRSSRRLNAHPKPLSSSTPSISSINSSNINKSLSPLTPVFKSTKSSTSKAASSKSSSNDGQSSPQLSSWLKSARPKPSSPSIRNQPNSRLPPRKRKLNLDNSSQESNQSSSLNQTESSDEEESLSTVKQRLTESNSVTVSNSSEVESSPSRPRRSKAGQNRRYDDTEYETPTKRRPVAVAKKAENNENKKPAAKMTKTAKPKKVVSKPLAESETSNTDSQASTATRKSSRQRKKKLP